MFPKQTSFPQSDSEAWRQRGGRVSCGAGGASMKQEGEHGIIDKHDLSEKSA